MPRKAFVADLQEAIRDFTYENFSDLRPGEEDGTIAFQYNDHGQNVTIQAICPGTTSRADLPLRMLTVCTFRRWRLSHKSQLHPMHNSSSTSTADYKFGFRRHARLQRRQSVTDAI